MTQVRTDVHESSEDGVLAYLFREGHRRKTKIRVANLILAEDIPWPRAFHFKNLEIRETSHSNDIQLDLIGLWSRDGEDQLAVRIYGCLGVFLSDRSILKRPDLEYAAIDPERCDFSLALKHLKWIYGAPGKGSNRGGYFGLATRIDSLWDDYRFSLSARGSAALDTLLFRRASNSALTWKDLVLTSPQEILAVQGVGKKSLTAIEGMLEPYGLRLGMDYEDLLSWSESNQFLPGRLHAPVFFDFSTILTKDQRMKLETGLKELRKRRHELPTVKDLVSTPRTAITSLRGVGKKSIRRLEELLATVGLKLGMSPDEIARWEAEHPSIYNLWPN
jgi:hypothetical protein